MVRKPVQSSNIVAVAYDQTTAELEIEFRSGGVYRYADVPATIYDQLIASESLGRQFAQSIKGTFQCRKVELLPVLVMGEPTEGSEFHAAV